MKRIILKQIILATLTVLAISSIGISARTGGSQTHGDFPSFWASFKAAVAAGDKEAVASMTKFPFLLQGEERDKAGFIKRFDTLFDKRAKRCFGTARPVKDNDAYELFCGNMIFIFNKVGGEYKFTEIGVND